MEEKHLPPSKSHTMIVVVVITSALGEARASTDREAPVFARCRRLDLDGLGCPRHPSIFADRAVGFAVTSPLEIVPTGLLLSLFCFLA